MIEIIFGVFELYSACGIGDACWCITAGLTGCDQMLAEAVLDPYLAESGIYEISNGSVKFAVMETLGS
jgi:hypothetical protein